jgi:hypothetical protein
VLREWDGRLLYPDAYSAWSKGPKVVRPPGFEARVAAMRARAEAGLPVFERKRRRAGA